MAANAAAVPLNVTVAAAPLTPSTLVLIFHAGSSFHLGYPCLNWSIVPAPAAGGQVTATLPMSIAIRTWGLRLQLVDPIAILAGNTVSCLTIAYTGVAWTRFLTELEASGLLSGVPYTLLRDSDAVLMSLTLTNPNSLSVLAVDLLPVESFDTPAAPAILGVAAAAAGRGRGRGRGGGVGAAPAIAAAPPLLGPPNLAFLNNASLTDFANSGEANPLYAFARLVGAVGDCATRASRLSPRFSAQPLAHALRRAAAAIAGVETTVAAAPDGDYIASAALPQTLAAAFDALTSVLQTDKASTALLAKELTDALILQRGDPAQVLTVISSRLHYIANRCDAFIAPPLHPVRIPARIHCTHSLHAFIARIPARVLARIHCTAVAPRGAFTAPPCIYCTGAFTAPPVHLLHRCIYCTAGAFTAPPSHLLRRCIYCTTGAFTAPCIYCTVHLLHLAPPLPYADVTPRHPAERRS